MFNLRHALTAIIVLSCLADPSRAGVRGIEGRTAPDWDVTQWINLNPESNKIDVGDFDGKVVYLYCFQSWCPGCHSSGFPTLKAVQQAFKDDEGVAFVAVQTTFEGFAHNTFEQAKEVAKKYGLDIPIGHSGTPEKRSTIMTRYRTGGTPWTILIDPDGVVRYNDFHIRPQQAIDLVNRLKRKNTGMQD